MHKGQSVMSNLTAFLQFGKNMPSAPSCDSRDGLRMSGLVWRCVEMRGCVNVPEFYVLILVNAFKLEAKNLRRF